MAVQGKKIKMSKKKSQINQNSWQKPINPSEPTIFSQKKPAANSPAKTKYIYSIPPNFPPALP